MSIVNYALDGDIAVLAIDHPPVNALGHAMRAALADTLARAAADPAARAIVILGTGTTFPAGADITEFGTERAFADPSLAALIEAVERSAKPVIATIHGTALGGGLELALACHARVAVASAKVGLPEVALGLLPGAGGTQRLPRLIGAEAAIDIMTSGRHVAAAQALELGILDAIVEEPRTGGLAFARAALADRRAFTPVIERTGKLAPDAALFARARAAVAAKARGRLAPLAIVDCVEAAATLPAAEGLAYERRRFAELLDSDQRRALVHYFFAEREARRVPGLPAGAKPLDVKRVAVIGSGTMGGGIAMVFANAGIAVRLVDVNPDALAKGRATIERNYATSVARGSTPRAKADAALARIEGTTDYADLADVDMAVEAVFEDMALKQRIFAELDRATPAHAILATNTSSLDIDAMAQATSRPGKVVGTHFFSPANVMKLLENVRGRETSAETIATVMALGRALGKVAVLAGNCDGFIGNRMIAFYGAEATFLLEEGASPAQIDRVAVEFGMPIGPLAMSDLAGIDVGVLVRRARPVPPGERVSQLSELLYDRGWIGQKAGRGFYRYSGRDRADDPEVEALIADESARLGVERRAIADDEIADRLFMPLVNEGAKILEDGIAARAGDIDVVYVNGYGWPAHKGGPMWWGLETGLGGVAEVCARLAERNGPRWAVSPLVERLAREGGGWPTPQPVGL